MWAVWATLGMILSLLILWDCFETIVSPRRVTRRIRLARLFIRYSWLIWSGPSRRIGNRRRKETYLSSYGPLALLVLLSIWAAGLVVGFALLQWGAGSGIRTPDEPVGFTKDLYLSGTTFFTLGLGDVVPRTPFARFLTVIEAGLGFGFLALVIGYLPALNQSFSRREVNISLLDAQAGSPSTAAEMLRRNTNDHDMEALRQLFYEWERWAAEFLEIHLSYPVLAYFRSQHDNQSWLSALTTILDTSALAIVGGEGACKHQAQLTFAIARHAVVDLSLVFSCPPENPKKNRLSPEDWGHLGSRLNEAGIRVCEREGAYEKLAALRQMYEPYSFSLGRLFLLTLPGWVSDAGRMDNWQASAWEPRARHRKKRLPGEGTNEHF